MEELVVVAADVPVPFAVRLAAFLPPAAVVLLHPVVFSALNVVADTQLLYA